MVVREPPPYLGELSRVKDNSDFDSEVRNPRLPRPAVDISKKQRQFRNKF